MGRHHRAPLTCAQETIGCSERQGFRSSEKGKLVRVEGVTREISEHSGQQKSQKK